MKRSDPETIVLQYRSGPIEVPIIRMVTLQGVRAFALHRDWRFSAYFVVSHIPSGGKIASGITEHAAISAAAAKASAAAKKYGSIEAAIKLGNERMLRAIRKRDREKASSAGQSVR